ncbi:hypothetical protein NTHI1209_00759 [Haemophilus influenzae]|uniref:Uncharacterized protein n=1 Tax=Haemophilus influenzae TaxID=727 RepID=A0A158SWB2_HAEIF|nr:hypothetical protein NTHI1209_00759 [Haemophilus influenzae]
MTAVLVVLAKFKRPYCLPQLMGKIARHNELGYFLSLQ